MPVQSRSSNNGVVAKGRHAAKTRKGGRRARKSLSVNMIMRKLTDLPTELIVEILCALPYLQLVELRRFCKRFKEIIDNTPILQYMIECSAAGYDPKLPLGVGVVAALEAFRRTQRAYRHPNIQTGAVLELDSEALRADEWDTFNPIHMDDMVFVNHLSRTAVGVLSLRTEVAEGERFRRLQFDFEFDIYFLCVSQDLIIFPSDNRLRFRSLATGEVPERGLAVRGDDTPILADDFPGEPFVWKGISISGDWMLVSLELRTGVFSRKLFQWSTGKAVQEWLSINDWGGCLIDGFAVIPIAQWKEEADDSESDTAADPGAYFNADPDSDEHLDLIRLPHPAAAEDYDVDAYWPISDAHTPGVMIYRLSSGLDSSPEITLEPVPLSIFEFPADFYYCAARGMCVMHAVDSAWPATSLVCDHAVPLLEFSLFAQNQKLIVPVSTFLTEEIKTCKPVPGMPMARPWKEWSPFARYLNARIDRTNVLRPYGSRGSHLVFEDRILDFNQYDTANNIYGRARARELRRTTHGKTVASESMATRRSQPTAMRCRHSKDWVTDLPFRGQKIDFPKAETGDGNRTLFLIEEEDKPKLVELMYRESRELHGLRYHAF